MAKKTKKHSIQFRRFIKPKKKPSSVVVDKMDANIEIVFDCKDEASANKVRDIEDKLLKEGEKLLDAKEKMLNEKLQELEKAVEKQVKQAERSGGGGGGGGGGGARKKTAKKATKKKTAKKTAKKAGGKKAASKKAPGKAGVQLKKINKVVKKIQNELGGEIREALEKIAKRERVDGKAISVGRNLFREWKIVDGIFADDADEEEGAEADAEATE